MDERTTLVAETPLQRLLMEKALAMAQELERAGAAAADGHVLKELETVAMAQGRELTRGALEGALQGHVDALEKNSSGPAVRMWPAPAAQRGLVAHDPDCGRPCAFASRLPDLPLRARCVHGGCAIGN
jgi:hypothetical protein